MNYFGIITTGGDCKGLITTGGNFFGVIYPTLKGVMTGGCFGIMGPGCKSIIVIGDGFTGTVGAGSD